MIEIHNFNPGTATYTIVLRKSAHPLLLSKFVWMSIHLGASFVWLMKCSRGVWEAHPRVLCMSEVRHFVLYFTDATARQLCIDECSRCGTHQNLNYASVVPFTVLCTGLDIKAAGGSTVFSLSNRPFSLSRNICDVMSGVPPKACCGEFSIVIYRNMAYV